MGRYMLSLRGLEKSFGEKAVLRDVSLEINAGEFFSLLGPSGCGKTTLLRAIGGQEVCDQGVLLLDGKDLSGTEPARRPVHMIFQRLALFPHLTVAGNISFGLKLRRESRNLIEQKVRDVLKTVELEGFEERRIQTLSGGQQQRVAIARAIVNEPRLLLLDEPLSALDLKLRQKMQIELRALQKKLGMTFVFVTHAQDEALSLSDRIAVMNHGVVEQVGTPQEIYARPVTPFVASFIGAANFLSADAADPKRGAARWHDGTILEARPVEGAYAPTEQSPVTIIVRPEHVCIERRQDAKVRGDRPGLQGLVSHLVFRGDQTEVFFAIQGSPGVQMSGYAGDVNVAVGDAIDVSWDKERAIMMNGTHQP